MSAFIDLPGVLTGLLVPVTLLTITWAVVTALTNRILKQKKIENEEIKALNESIKLKIKEYQAKTLEEINDKIPTGTSLSQLESSLDKIIKNNLLSTSKTPQESLNFVSELIVGYHQQALSQARIQFWLSVVAATAGFIYIIAATSRANDTSSIILSALPGVVIDCVAFLFFKQAEQTRERATALYDRLRQDRQIESAREMLESIEDKHISSLVKAQISLHMSGLNPKEIDLQSKTLKEVK